MQFFQAEYTDQAITEQYLGNVLLLYPEIKKDLTRQICEDLSLVLLNKVIGFGRTVTETQMKNTEKMSIAANKIQWTVLPWLREILTITAAKSGDGTNDSEVTIHLDKGWVTPGMVLMFQNGEGQYINIMITSVGTAESGGYSYTGKIVTHDPTLEFTDEYCVVGQQVGWSYELVAACADTSTRVPVVVPSWFENWTTTTMIDRDVCSTGIQTLLWIENPDGSRCWETWEDWQMFQNFLKSWEFKGWYQTRTYDGNNSDTINLTDQDGNSVGAGDGVFPQVANGNVTGYDVNTYKNPSNYEAFRTLIEDTIGVWATQNGLTAGIELDVWAGFNAYQLLQRVLTNFADQAGGCCYVMDYESGNEYEVKAGIEFKQYWFAGFKLNLRKCAVFNDPSVQGFTVSGTPWESWKFVMMPDTTCDGVPLIQYYSRAGCGTSNAFIHKVIPGTINPMDLSSPIATSHKKGYNTFYNSEGVFVVNDPSKILVFRPTTA